MEREIFRRIEKEKLEEVLTALHWCIGLQVQLLDEDGVNLITCGERNEYCRCFQKFLRPGETCAAFHQKAAAYSLQLGEAYTFTCHSELNHIVFPVVGDGILLGSVLVGPFLMESPDASMISAVAGRYHLKMDDALSLYETMQSVSIVDPKKINQINKLMYYLFSNITEGDNVCIKNNRDRSMQQSSISNAIHHYKSEEIMQTVHYPFEKEQQLIRNVRAGNVKEAKDILNDLLGYVLLSSGHSLIGSKARSMELCTILSRTVIDAGADETEVMERSAQFLQGLEDIHDIDSLCFSLQGLTEYYISQLFGEDTKADNSTIQRAIEYMSQNFKKNLTLNEVAQNVYLNPSYFSSLFKQAMGVSFKEYLTDMRIEEARQLLIKTNTSIVDIALSCGFTNQSYFSKVFKAKTGFSPKSFRN